LYIIPSKLTIYADYEHSRSIGIQRVFCPSDTITALLPVGLESLLLRPDFSDPAV